MREVVGGLTFGEGANVRSCDSAVCIKYTVCVLLQECTIVKGSDLSAGL